MTVVPGDWRRRIGLLFFVLSFVFYGCLILVPLAPASVEGRIALSALLVVLGEGSFWLSVLILGREMIERLRRFEWRSRLSAWLKK